MAGRDVLGLAHTGSGKTAAFLLPLLQRLEQAAQDGPRRVRVLIVVPTRELCSQIGADIREWEHFLPYSVKFAAVFGGVSINPQMMHLRGGADIVVATPGRLLDLIDHKALTLGDVETVVLDEADRLLDLGFAEELSRILGLLPPKRQHLLFSATFPEAVEGLAHDLMHDPLRVEIAPEPERQSAIQQRAIAVDPQRRTQLLRHLIERHDWRRVLVFVASRHAADTVAAKLRKGRIAAEPCHGDLSQGKRQQVLSDFKAARLSVVVATDVAARGLDIVQLPVVVNYDLPRSVVDYTHRIGRTGRAGARGLAVSFVTAEAEAHFRLIEKRQQMPVDREQVEGFERMETLPDDTVAIHPVVSIGGIKGRRPSKKDKRRASAALAREDNPSDCGKADVPKSEP
jgi:superfamily II DNA/RNA helicase